MNAELADYAALGVKWLRTNIWWDVAQPTKSGSYNWAPMDKAINAAASYGIEIIGELVGTPSWVDGSFSTAASRDAFGEFARAAAAHFDDRVDYWEIRNEPNMQGVTPANYVRILKAAHASIKSVDDGDMVITGGLAATPQTGNGLWGAVDYLKQMYANGAKGYFDAVGFHPYTYPLMPNDPAPWNGWQIMEDGIRPTMVTNGDGGLQVWMTELGAPTAGSGQAMSQSQQAQILQQAHDIASGYSWAGPIMWYSYQDQGGSTGEVENWFGLLGPNGTRKAAYYTYKELAGESSPPPVVDSPPPAGARQPTFTTENFTGNNQANNIVGNDRDNTIWAEGGDDTIEGGRGNDTLWGGRGADRFVFSGLAFGLDTIADFEPGDKIDLSGIDADSTRPGDQAFTFIGSKWLGKPGDLGAYRDPAGHVSLQGDVNGDGRWDFSIRILNGHEFVASDFIL